ncbi:MAG: 16S rRNA (cytidine(1402)-2'-O)-methyltransferase [Geminicoccaceae bacterium]|nr:16S rRNA (cytidine(1402)-2'-O)-methyltransferase [Geminicoccaceae bacterium]
MEPSGTGPLGQSAVDAERANGRPAPGLHVVATPIGNLGDLSPRALSTLGGVDLVLAEDTRVTGRLLHRFNVKAPMLAYHDHNGERVRPGILARLAAGEALALVSDAGTPCLADPGFKLVRAARAAGHPVFAVPGPSSIAAALSVSGLPSDRFFFQGFLPAKAAARRRALADLARVPGTLVFLEAPHRLRATLEAAAAAFGPREAVVAREITKLHEEVRAGLLPDLAAAYAEETDPKGEIVLLVGPAPEEAPLLEGAALEAALDAAVARLGPSAAAAELAPLAGRPRRELYALALGRKGG